MKTECPFCHARILFSEFVRHDIAAHDGLSRAREQHESVCQSPDAPLDPSRCLCSLLTYEVVARAMGIASR